MKIKGHTRIELRDVVTGSEQIIEHDNVITEFAAEYFREGGALNAYPLGSLQDAFPLDDLFGGLMLFDQPILQNADETGRHSKPLYPPAGLKMTGNASIDVSANSPTVTELGQYNSGESSASNTDRTYVFDFDTNEANGNISCICLTTRIGGYIGQGNTTSDARDTSTKTARLFDFNGQTSDARTIVASTLARLAGLDLAQGQAAVLAKTAAECFDDGAATINWFDVPTKKLNPFISKLSFDDSLLLPRRTEQKTFTRRDVAAARVCGGTGYILLLGASANTINANVTVYGVQFNKDGTITTFAQTVTGANPGIPLYDTYFIGGKIIDGALYIAYGGVGAEDTKRIKIASNGATTIQTISGDREKIFASFEGRLYYGSSNIYDPTLNRIEKTNAQRWNISASYFNTGFWNVYDGPQLFCVYGKESQNNPKASPLTVFRPPCNWLSTINNLSQTVTKQATQTMKITYTLTLQTT